jgi:oxazoline/thiazoline dehydrogenase
MERPLVLRLRPEAALIETPDGRPAVRAPWGVMALAGAGPGLRAAFALLATEGAPADALVDLAATDSGLAVARFMLLLARWREQAWLSYTVPGATGSLVTLVPVTRGYTPAWDTAPPDSRFRLSRFTYVRQEGNALALASPAAPVRALFTGPTGAALLATAARTASVHDFAALSGLPETDAGWVVALLAGARLVERVDAAGAPVEPESEATAQWEFHDLLMHQHARDGRHGGPYGGTFPFLDRILPLPSVKPLMSAERVPLCRPDIERPACRDMTLTQALEERRSVRAYAEAPLTAAQVGEFLYRTARVREVTPADHARGSPYETSSRPYPSGGAAYDIELYVAVARCTGLAPGLYHYDPEGHTLQRLPTPEAQWRALIGDAIQAVPLASPPQVLIVLASRFQRLSWKYRGIAYALTLKHAGVLTQTMYLVATAMGLAPCAVGGGSTERFAAATGLDPLVESSVGEFLLGSAPPTE